MQEIAAETKRKLAFKVAPFILALAGMVGAASADGINWTPIAQILNGLGTEFLPALLNLVMNALPILVCLAVIGFILSFLGRIIQMIKI